MPLRIRKARKYRNLHGQDAVGLVHATPTQCVDMIWVLLTRYINLAGKTHTWLRETVLTSGSYRNQLEGSLLLNSFFITNFLFSNILLCGKEGLPPVRSRQQKGPARTIRWAKFSRPRRHIAAAPDPMTCTSRQCYIN